MDEYVDDRGSDYDDLSFFFFHVIFLSAGDRLFVTAYSYHSMLLEGYKVPEIKKGQKYAIKGLIIAL